MVRTKEEIHQQVIEEMQSLGVYKEEYKQTIKIFAGMIHQYEVFEQQFEETEYQLTELHKNRVGAVNERKVPLYTAMESLRKDIATYSSLLCLNPKQLTKTKVEKQDNGKLAEIIAKLG